MTTIWKFPIEIADEVLIEAPYGMKPLCVQLQGGTACLWAEVDPSRFKIVHRFFVRGTGHQMNVQEGQHLGTVQMDVLGAPLVFHFFAERKDFPES